MKRYRLIIQRRVLIFADDPALTGGAPLVSLSLSLSLLHPGSASTSTATVLCRSCSAVSTDEIPATNVVVNVSHSFISAETFARDEVSPRARDYAPHRLTRSLAIGQISNGRSNFATRRSQAANRFYGFHLRLYAHR